ncbi:hypothetical protein [Brenneria goodwinii]|uniref:hypothetical protein n=1 Tax=Brenneria goodwinii TaxID=1109412 RepID=UPI0012E2C63B|nr:hypothetical protein [Brenneria goodwinii]
MFRSSRLETLIPSWILGGILAIICAMFLTLSGWFFPLLASVATLAVLLILTTYWEDKVGLLDLESSHHLQPSPRSILRMTHETFTSPTTRDMSLSETEVRMLVERERIDGQVYDYECLLPEKQVISWSGSPIRFSADGRYGIAALMQGGLYICDRKHYLQFELYGKSLPAAQDIALCPGESGRLTLQQFFYELKSIRPYPQINLRKFAPYHRCDYIVAEDEDLIAVSGQAARFIGKPIDELFDRIGRRISDDIDSDKGFGTYEWHTATKILQARSSSNIITSIGISDRPLDAGERRAVKPSRSSG